MSTSSTLFPRFPGVFAKAGRALTCCERPFPADRSPVRPNPGPWPSFRNSSLPLAAPYCGSLGYLGFDGAMDLSILIRTITAGGVGGSSRSAAGSLRNLIPEASMKKPATKREDWSGRFGREREDSRQTGSYCYSCS